MSQDEILRVQRWERVELQIKHPAPLEDPYRDVKMMATFTNPDGEDIFAKGFYERGDCWKVRFRPESPGHWKYELSFSDKSNSLTGSFSCGHGCAEAPISVNPVNPKWFCRGTAPFMVRALHIGDRFFADNWDGEKRTEFLDWCKEQGYNTLSIASFFLNRRKEGRGAGWETPALWPLNPEAFVKAESILNDLEERDFMVFPFAGIFGQDSNYPRSVEDQNLFIEYVMARWGSYRNLLLNIAGPEPMIRGEWLPRTDVNRMGRRIAAESLYNTPLTVHNQTNQEAFGDMDYVSFTTVQGPKTVDRTRLYEGLLSMSRPDKPQFAQETLWSDNMHHKRSIGHDYTDDDIRKNAFTILMAGAEICFADNHGDSSSGFSGSLDLSERSRERHTILKNAWDFFETLPYFEMIPAPECISGTGICMAQAGRRYLVYMESGGTAELLLDSSEYGVVWMNARKPSESLSGETVSGSAKLIAPDSQDWFAFLNCVRTDAPSRIHLSWECDPATSFTVTWCQEKPSRPIVLYRKKGDMEWKEAIGCSHEGSAGESLHKVTVENLLPGTEYEYCASESKVCLTVRTAPTDESPVTCTFLSDTGLIGRLDGNATGTCRIRDEILQNPPHLLLGGGDYAYANRDQRFDSRESAIGEWFVQWEPVLAQTPFMTQYGNHEIYLQESYEDWAPYFAHPDGFDNGRNYSFDVGCAHFTSLFVPSGGQYKLSSEQLKWLEKDLKEARENGALWLIVFQHESIFGHGRSHPSSREFRQILTPIFERCKIDLHLSAHDQNYERTFPLIEAASEKPGIADNRLINYSQGNGVIYAKVSPAGKRSEIGNRFSTFTVPQQEFMARRDDSAHHYINLTITPFSLRAETMRLEDGTKPSNVFDVFTIHANNR